MVGIHVILGLPGGNMSTSGACLCTRFSKQDKPHTHSLIQDTNRRGIYKKQKLPFEYENLRHLKTAS